MNPTLKAMRSAAAILGGFSLIGIGLVAAVHGITAERIAANQHLSLLRNVQNLLPADGYDNDPLADTLIVRDARLGTEPVPIYRARLRGQPVAAVFAPTAADGYSGDIRLLAAVLADGSLSGVRVLAHKETPGLGDAIDAEKSGWIFGFTGLSLANPVERLWKVKRDGGAFDQFTGATVTPRAIVKAVRNTLAYFRENQAAVFAGDSSAQN